MVEIRRALYEDYYRVLNIADNQLGKGYMKGVLHLASHNPLWVAVDKTVNEVVGFIFLRISEEKAEIKSMAVQLKYQKQGIGTSMVKKVLGEFQEAKRVEVIAWEQSDSGSIPLQSLLIESGFSITSKKPNFWYEDSIRRGFDCPSCGNPCNCSAVIFSNPNSCS
jgi:ribosomal protein S18 acetylase RimI-like enzyme